MYLFFLFLSLSLSNYDTIFLSCAIAPVVRVIDDVEKTVSVEHRDNTQISFNEVLANDGYNEESDETYDNSSSQSTRRVVDNTSRYSQFKASNFSTAPTFFPVFFSYSFFILRFSPLLFYFVTHCFSFLKLFFGVDVNMKIVHNV